MKTNSPDFQTNKDKTFTLNIVLKQADIAHERQSVLREVQANFETKGFRKGKAPLNIVEANVSETKIVEEILNHLISQTYQKQIEEHHLHPVIQPQIKVTNPPLTFDKDWQVEIIGCELPEITIDSKYTDEIKKINQGKEDNNEKLNLTIEALIKNSTVELPDILLKADIDHKLSQLVDQTQSAGITVSEYLKSRHETLDKYQENLQKQVKSEWIVNLAIDKIARDQKLNISEEEAKEIISKNPQLSENPNLVYYLLTQQKVFDYLKKL